MEMICRALLVYCVKHYKGDEKIKSFIWELITPTKDGQAQTLQNHSGAGWQRVLPSLFRAPASLCSGGPARAGCPSMASPDCLAPLAWHPVQP